MKKYFAIAAIAGVALMGANTASAQSDSNWVKVNAKVVGIFDFTIDNADWLTAATAATYNFGDVTVGMTTADYAGTAIVGGDAFSTTFTEANAFVWEVRSAPKSNVTITFQNAANTGGTLGLEALEISMDGTYYGLDGAGGTQLFQQNDVGNGGNAVDGDIGLRLTVTDTDTAGDNSFTVELVATGV